MAKFSFGQGLKLALSIAAIAAFIGFAPVAHAAAANSLLLCISDTDFGCFGSGAGNSVSVYWNGGLSTGVNGNGTFVVSPILNHDTSSNVNGVTVDATLGVFSFNIDTGTYMGPGNAMDFNIDNIDSTGAGTLYLVFGADNYNSGAPFHLNGSATLGSGVASETDTACFEPGNGGYIICGGGSSPDIGTASTTTSGGMSFSSSVMPGTNPFGLEQDVTIHFTGQGQVSGDLQLVAAPEPTSILLFGGALALACGAIRRKLHN